MAIFRNCRRRPYLLRDASAEIQPVSTVVIDLSVSEDELLSGMKQKTRYNVRLAEKKGVEVTEGDESDLDAWYDLYIETAERDRIALHEREYYRMLFEMCRDRRGEDVDCRLLLAKTEGQLLAGIWVFIYGSSATYLYGASSNEKRNLMPAYALQWTAMRLAKDAGCTRYVSFGIPSTDDPSHPMHGLYRMKTGFGGKILHRPGCWDYPMHPVVYALYRFAEDLREILLQKPEKEALNLKSHT